MECNVFRNCAVGNTINYHVTSSRKCHSYYFSEFINLRISEVIFLILYGANPLHFICKRTKILYDFL